jgi:hypothetical protein
MLSAFCNLQFAICNLQFLFNFLITTNFDRIVQYSSKYCIIVQFHHAFSILHQLHAPLQCSLARQPCPAALPASLARQPCPPALPASLARQPCPPALPASLGEKLASCFTAVGRHACMQYCILLLGRQFSSSFPRN